jgi:hypothetical protein
MKATAKAKKLQSLPVKESVNKPKYSYSKINTYLTCPKKYFWAYEGEGPGLGLVPKVSSRNLRLGDVTHRLRALYFEEKLTKNSFKNLDLAVKKAFPELTEPEAYSIAFEAGRLVQAYINKYGNDSVKMLSPEVVLEWDAGPAILTTRLDGIAQTPDGRIWRDELKTAAKMDSMYLQGLKKGLQAGIAHVVMKNVLPQKPVGTIYTILVKTKEPQAERTMVLFERSLEDRTMQCVKGVHSRIIARDFYPSLNCFQYNRACDYSPLCRNDNPRTREEFFKVLDRTKPYDDKELDFSEE